jgi:hypothetical protein
MVVGEIATPDETHVSEARHGAPDFEEGWTWPTAGSIRDSLGQFGGMGDFGFEGAGGEAGTDALAGLGITGVAEEGASGWPFGGVNEGVATAEDGEGREGFEPGGGMIEAGGAGRGGSAREAEEAVVRGFEAALGEDEADGGVVALQAGDEGCEASCG